MLKDSSAPKPKKPPRGKNNVEISDDEFSSTSSTFSSSSPSLLSSPCPSRKDIGKKGKRKEALYNLLLKKKKKTKEEDHLYLSLSRLVYLLLHTLQNTTYKWLYIT